ncbi:hypothetical protein [Thauera humireducens]|uniref:Uncharacterized protein n=1 Tax=Thauera humireducens TaxID=1134435 RepID=A0A127K3T3_9RHOO|nr:hypothetical protein [Thauera humireducens]AMO36616.1 hypothetical protein AC731_006470 [Thauera humireducens]
MTSFVFNSALRDEAVGNIDYDTDTFKVMLLTSAASPNKDTWAKRSDVTNEATGTGYPAGGAAATVTVGAVDTANDRVEITLGGAAWAASTITARYAVYYKSRGGAATADELIAVNDFGADVTSTNGTFTLNASTYRKNNP